MSAELLSEDGVNSTEVRDDCRRHPSAHGILAGGDAGAITAFQEIVETLPVAVYSTDPEGRLSFFNGAAKKLSGLTPSWVLIGGV